MEIVWHGTNDEKLALIQATNRHCGCEKTIMGIVTKQAGCHDIMMPTSKNQRVWDGLIFMRRIAGRLLIEELGPQHRMIPQPKYTPADIGRILRMGMR